jgi:hypothetical protein
VGDRNGDEGNAEPDGNRGQADHGKMLLDGVHGKRS